MSHARRIATVLILLPTLGLLPAALAAQDWAGRARISGSVEDEQGQPLAGATVELHPADQPEAGPEPIKTNDKGKWSYLGLADGTWVIDASADGYVTAEARVNASEFTVTPPVQMKLRKNPLASIGRGEKLLKEGKFAEARAAYQEALPAADEEQKARLQTRIGDTYLDEGNLDQAKQSYLEALPDLNADEQLGVELRLGELYMKDKEYAKARQQYQNALPQVEGDEQSKIMVSIARSYDEEGQHDQAIKTLEDALAKNPGNADIIQVLADLLTRAGRDDEAKQYLAQLPQGTKLPADMTLNMGIRSYNGGKMAEALDYFNRAVTDNPDNPDVYYYRGLVYLNQNKKEEAKADFQKLLQIDPKSPHADEVKQFLAYLEKGS